MLPVSVCLIARNEELYIGECLKRLAAYPWEILLMDTGSSDDTLKIASGYSSNIYHYKWTDDFSAARNYAVSKAKNDWILSIDCDEYLQTLTPNALFSFEKLLRTPGLSGSIGTIQLKSRTASDWGVSTVSQSLPRFFHREHYHFTGGIHEQLTPKGCFTPSYFELPFAFLHMGYENESIKAQKVRRNLPLLEKELAKKGPDPYLYFQLGQSCYAVHDYEKALSYFDKGLSFDLNPALDYVKTMVESYGYCLLSLKRFEEALTLEGVYKEFCGHGDFVFLMGLIYMNNALFKEAVAEFEKAAVTECSLEAINSHLAFYNIGVIYECTGQLKQAALYYKKCGNYEPALTALKRTGN